MSYDVPLQVDVEQVEAMRHDGRAVTVLDVREPWETQICALESSLMIPLGTLAQNLNKLPTEGPLVVVCHHGMRSMQAVAFLRQKGFENATNLRGGIDAWAQRIDPAMAKY